MISGGTIDDPLNLLPRGLSKLYSMWVGARYPFASKGSKLSLHYTTDIRNPALIELGNDVIVQKDVWLHAWYGNKREPGAVLTVGDACLIARRSHITARNRVVIESDVIVSASVLIQDHGHAYTDVSKPIRLQGIIEGGRIRIGRGSWIGQGAAIVCTEGELVLGENCVVAANAVVTKSVPAWSVVSGNPARVVKQYDPARKMWVLGSCRTAEPETVRAVEPALALVAR